MGERGARTRQAIVEAALGCFEAKGFHGTLVDDIAEAVGISRAGLYQYFESKEQLFIELVHEGGADLLRVIRRLGALGPTAEGYDNLHWWLGEWAWVHDKYRAIYLQWAVVDSPEAPLRPLMAQFTETYAGRMSTRLAPAVGDDVDYDLDAVVVALLAVLLRVNDYRQIGVNRGLSDDEILDGLATFVQLALFPSTPASALVAHSGADRTPVPVPAAPPPTPDPFGGRLQPDPERFGSGSERVLQTVRRLLDAGATVFAAKGFHATSVEDIRCEAGLGRGTFYKYFEDKAALLAVLSEDCAVRLGDLIVRFPGAVVGEDEPVSLRGWLVEFLGFHRRYRSVFRAWTEQDPAHGAVAELGSRVGEALLQTFDAALAQIDRDHPFDVRVGSLVLLAMFERVPGYAFGTAYEMSEDQMVEVLAGLVERGLLRRQPAGDRRVTQA